MSTVRPRVLFVDDDPNILEAFQRQLARRFDVHTASGGALGLQLLESAGPFPVVVSDMRMPIMNGAQFLAAARARSPDTSRILLTGNSELGAAIEAVNEGQIFRFVCKPCTPELLCKVVDAGVEQYRLRRAEQDLLETTLRGSIDALGEVLSLACPQAFGRARRIQRIVVALARASGIDDVWQVEVAALLSQLGAVTLPAEVLERWTGGSVLHSAEQAMVDRLPAIAQSLLQRIPRLERVCELIRLQAQSYAPACEGAAPLEARILRVAMALDALHARGVATDVALQALGTQGSYDPALLRCARSCLEPIGAAGSTRAVALQMLKPGMVLDEDLRDEQQGMLLVARGHVVSESLLIRLLNLRARPGLPQFVRILGQ